jgi:hypothetical protein
MHRARLSEEQEPCRLAVSRKEALQCRPVVPVDQQLLHRRRRHAELLRQKLGHVLVPRIHRHAALADGVGAPSAVLLRVGGGLCEIAKTKHQKQKISFSIEFNATRRIRFRQRI